MAWDIAEAAHIGGRDEQQDRVATFEAKGGGACLLVVADGMGGHKGGALAAAAVVETARDLWRETPPPVAEPDRFLGEICARTHARINALGGEMGLSPRSTCVILYGDRARAHWVSLGDSRLYRFRDGTLRERTRDQSVVQMLVDMGKITEAEMADHPDQNRLLQSLGGDKIPEPVFGTAKIHKGDGFLLCSDGLWETVDTAEMAAGLSAGKLARAAEELVRKAARRGGAKGDNIAVAMARFGAKRRSLRLLLVGSLALIVAAAAVAVSFVMFPSSQSSLRDPDPAVALPLQPEKPRGMAAPAAHEPASGKLAPHGKAEKPEAPKIGSSKPEARKVGPTTRPLVRAAPLRKPSTEKIKPRPPAVKPNPDGVASAKPTGATDKRGVGARGMPSAQPPGRAANGLRAD